MQGTIDLMEYVKKFRKKWYLFAISFLIFVSVAMVLIWTMPPKFKITSKVKVNDEPNVMVVENLIEDVNLVQEKKNISNEIGILQSYSLVFKTLSSLDYKVFYSLKSNFREVEIHHERSPFKIAIDTSSYQLVNTPIAIEFITPNQFILSVEGSDKDVYHFTKNQLQRNKLEDVSIVDTLNFGDIFNHEYLQFRILRNLENKPESGQQYTFVINDMDKLAEDYTKKLNINTLTRDASILELKLNGVVPQREIDFLDRLVNFYIQQNYQSKNQIAVNTINFIDRQLAGISDSLNNAEQSLQRFRSYNNVLDLGYESRNYLDELKALEKRNANEVIKTQYYDYLTNNVISNSDLNEIVAPSVVGIEDPTLNHLINNLTQLESERTSLKFAVKEKNPKYTILNENLTNLKKAIVENVNNLKVSSNISIENNNARINEIKGLISEIPKTETILQKAQRKFEFNDNIFNFLLQKRTEAAIIKESNVPNNIIVDKAQLIGSTPVSPNKKLIIAAATIFSLFIPFCLILVQDIVNNKITNKKELTKHTRIPILGEVGHYKNGHKNGFSNGVLTNDFRALSIKLDAHGPNKVIGLTSSLKGEGKSFCALQLAKVMANTGRKVVLVDTNFENPSLHQPLGIENSLGVRQLLPGYNTLEDVIVPSKINNLSLIPTGNAENGLEDPMIPRKLEPMVNALKDNFDHIIFDSSSLHNSPDYLVIKQLTDLNLFVARQNFTTNDLSSINELAEESNQNGSFFLFNDTRS